MSAPSETVVKTVDFKHKALTLIEALCTTPAGKAIYDHVAQVISSSEQTHVEIEAAYAAILAGLIETLGQQVAADSPLFLHAKLLQKRLAPPLALMELQALHEHINKFMAQLPRDETLWERAFTPLLEAFGAHPESLTPRPERHEALATAPPPPPPPQSVAGAPSTIGGVTSLPRLQSVPDSSASSFTVEQRAIPEASAPHVAAMDVAYRQQLAERRRSIQEIQESLADQLREAAKQCEDFGASLEIELNRLQRAGNIQVLGVLRQALINETQKLLQNNKGLSTKLQQIDSALDRLQADNEDLTEEITRVHLLSLTDELTSLPNRRAFMRRLEDEVGRVQRYGSPLSLAMIDLDDFKQINDQYGHTAGDEVLRNFSANILSVFRHHDMVSRYGGEEFAVLLPNTNNEGALWALKKVQKRAQDIRYECNGVTLPMPTFSAGVALYKPGETPSSLISRADSALYRAKRMGRNRLEVELPPGPSNVGANI